MEHGKQKLDAVLITILFICGLALSLPASLAPANSLLRWFSTDDAFYYFKVAQNVTTGHGFTFDGMNATNGYHPLWMGVCLAVFWTARFNLILPLRIIVVISGLLNAGSAVCLFLILRKYLHKRVAFLTAAAWAVLPAVFKVTTMRGLETGLSIFMLLWLMAALKHLAGKDAVTRTDLLKAGVIAALAVLARLDNIFYVAAICLFFAARVRFPRMVVFFDFLSVGIAAYTGWTFFTIIRPGQIDNFSVYPLLVLGLFLKPLLMFVLGAYKPVEHNNFKHAAWMVEKSLVTALFFLGLFYLIDLLGWDLHVSKPVIFADAAATFALLSLNHIIDWRFNLEKAGQPREPLDRTGWLQRSFFVALPPAAALLIYVVINKLLFLSFTPISGRIKHYWSLFGNTIYTRERTLYDIFGIGNVFNPWGGLVDGLKSAAKWLSGVVGLDGRVNSVVIYMALACVIAAILTLIFLSAPAKYRSACCALLAPLLIGGILRITFYILYGYTGFRNWYWVTETLLLFFTAALFLDMLVDRLDKWRAARWVLTSVTALLVGFCLWQGVAYMLKVVPPTVPANHAQDYLAEVNYLESVTPPGAIIGITGSGMDGYFIHDRTVVNLDGLINSEAYYQSLLQRKGALFLSSLDLQYIWGKEHILLETDPYRQIFTGCIAQIESAAGYDGNFLFEYVKECASPY